MTWVRRLHPLLFAAFPVAALLASNLGQVNPADTVRSFAVSIGGTVVLLLVLRLVLKDWSRAALLASGGLLVFFSYGHVYGLIKSASVGDFILGRHRYLVLLALGALTIWSWWVIRRMRVTATAAEVLSVAGIAALVVPAYQIAAYYLAPLTGAANQPSPSMSVPTEESCSGPLPDIYYIILDGYPREDVLQSSFDLDNSEFIAALERRGFFVAGESRSNYMMTLLSLVSSLNMEYLDQLAAEMGAHALDQRVLGDRMAHSSVRSFLEACGYEMVAFETGWPSSEIRDAAIFESPGEEHISASAPLWGFNEFEILLLRSSLVRPVIDRLQVDLQGEDSPLEWPYLRHRDRILFTLDTMKEIPSWEGDYFVFAHMVMPHPPFAFGPNGESIPHTRPYSRRDGSEFEGTTEEYEQGYRDQVTFANGVVIRLIDRLLAASDPDPVIILQGDHGARVNVVWDDPEASDMREAFAILNAYHLPWEGDPRPYESISPVNSFRILLNGLFGQKLEMLPDRSFLTINSAPLELLEVAEEEGQR
jgi:hypothetical protein